MVFVKVVQVVPGLKGWLIAQFDDDSIKLININPLMQGVLEKLNEQPFFEKVYVDPELRTVTWPGELDLDPDNLYHQGIEIEQIQTLVKAIKNNDVFEKFIFKGVN